MYDPFNWRRYKFDKAITPIASQGEIPVWLVTIGKDTKYRVRATTWGQAKIKAAEKYIDTHNTELSFGELVYSARARCLGVIHV